MAISKTKKNQILDKLSKSIPDSKIIILFNFAGFTMEQLTELRGELRQKDAELKIIKNTLIKKAFLQNNLELDENVFFGPKSLVLGYADEAEPAKIVVKFLKNLKKPEAIMGAIYQNQFIPAEMVAKLAKIPDRKILEAQLVSQLAAPISGLQYVLKANISGLISIIKQYSKKNKS
ncbi:MAG TPA: 50S ribosomal protein L10 [Patescibacteria group bacterium]|nr:50S ribosomal protein L10 [Patescibacteria group bacterium]